MLTMSAKYALDGSPVDKKLFGEQFLAKIKETASADKLVKGLTKSNAPTTKSFAPGAKQTPHPKARKRKAPCQEAAGVSSGKGSATEIETPLKVGFQDLS